MNKEMKQYTGTKTVKAMPMTMGEAYERKLLKEGVRPSGVKQTRLATSLSMKTATSRGRRQMYSRRLISRPKRSSTECFLKSKTLQSACVNAITFFLRTSSVL